MLGALFILWKFQKVYDIEWLSTMVLKCP